MSVVGIVQQLSARVCEALIGSNLLFATLTVADASNTTPIVIETEENHILITGAVVRVQSVGGNTAANDYWNVTVTGPTTFELDGSVGNGAYTSGGTVKVAVCRGSILLGRQWRRQNLSPPCIIAVPTSSKFLPRDQYATADSTTYTEPQREALEAPSVATNRMVFEIMVWGVASPPDSDGNFTSTEYMVDQIIRSADEMTRGNYTMTDGKWYDQEKERSQDMKLGHYFVFGLTIDAPVTATPLEFVDPGTTGEIAVYYESASGSQELAVIIEQENP